MKKNKQNELIEFIDELQSDISDADSNPKNKQAPAKKLKKSRPPELYITGDIHGDIERFENKKLKKLKKNDILFVCGDFGFIWDGTKKERKILKKLGKKKYNILFVEGCHENYKLLYEYKQEEFYGGKTRVISGRLRQLMRGEIFDFDGVSVFAFGGGQTADDDWRSVANTVWEEELPDLIEINRAYDNLSAHENNVDYIITHEPPAQIRDFLGDSERSVLLHNQLNAAFDVISEKCRFRRWIFGKCHRNKIVSPRYQAVFNDIFKLERPVKLYGKNLW